ncbi:hypothetical protein BC832DRAFT_88728 [Gaertneriomyces semiglobifer]|nr:hypothetical protein BC832DRAFT_88728 [Gaertneriomyces semiglobifer]
MFQFPSTSQLPIQPYPLPPTSGSHLTPETAGVYPATVEDRRNSTVSQHSGRVNVVHSKSGNSLSNFDVPEGAMSRRSRTASVMSLRNVPLLSVPEPDDYLGAERQDFDTDRAQRRASMRSLSPSDAGLTRGESVERRGSTTSHIGGSRPPSVIYLGEVSRSPSDAGSRRASANYNYSANHSRRPSGASFHSAVATVPATVTMRIPRAPGGSPGEISVPATVTLPIPKMAAQQTALQPHVVYDGEYHGVALAADGSQARLIGDGRSVSGWNNEKLPQQKVAEYVEAIWGALRGVGTRGLDARTLTQILGTLPPAHATQLSEMYKATYGKSLSADVKSHTSGKFGKLCCGLVTPLAEFDAKWLYKAMHGLGTDEDILIETLVGRSNAEIAGIKEAYKNLHGKDLEEIVTSETSGDFRKLMIAILQAKRDEEETSYNAEADVETLYQESKASRWAREPIRFISLLCGRSDTHLVYVFQLFQRKHGTTIEDMVRKHTGAILGKALMCLIQSVNNRAAHVATLFEHSLHGFWGPSNTQLMRLLVRYRDPRVMKEVRAAYHEQFGRSLYRRVEDVTNGDFRRLALLCVGLEAGDAEYEIENV